jgi:hypothetical protein
MCGIMWDVKNTSIEKRIKLFQTAARCQENARRAPCGALGHIQCVSQDFRGFTESQLDELNL